MSKTAVLLLSCILLLCPAAGWAQCYEDAYRTSREGTAGLRLGAGAAWSFGSSFENVGSGNWNLAQPFGTAGLVYNFHPWIRMGLDYSYTQFARTQYLSNPDPAVYRNLKTRFHAASLTAELNFLGLGKPAGKGRWGLYLGAGAGYLWGLQNQYALTVSNEMDADALKQTVHFGGHNEPLTYGALFIPVTLSLEYAVLPQVSVSLGGGFRFLPVQKEFAPRYQAYAQAGLVFNIGPRKRYARTCAAPVAPYVPVHDTVYVEKPVEKVVEKIVEVPVKGAFEDVALPYVTFVRGSSVLDEKANAAALATLSSVLKLNPDWTLDIQAWTDHTGTDEINAPLSEARAEALKAYLVGQGVDVGRIRSVKGMGKAIAEGEEALSAHARRAEVILEK